MISVEDAATFLSSVDALYKSEVRNIILKKKELSTEKKLLENLITTGASVNLIQEKSQTTLQLSSDIDAQLLYVKTLIQNKKIAQTIIATSSPVAPASLIPPSVVSELQATSINSTNATFTSVSTNEIVLPDATITSNNGCLILGGTNVAFPRIMDDLICTITPRSASGNTAASVVNINGTSIYGYEFVSNATREISFCCQLSHQWEEGSAIVPHIHWVPTNNNTGNCIFDMDYWVVNIGEAMPASTRTSVTVAASGVPYKHQIVGYGIIPMTGKTASCIFGARMYRVGGSGLDTFTGNSIVLSVDLHIYSNRMGLDIIV